MKKLLIILVAILLVGGIAVSASAMLINSVSVHSRETSNVPYEVVDQLLIVHNYYVDRDYIISGQPAGFDEYEAIKTDNTDKNNLYDDYMTITLSAPATVYVAYDARGLQPDWQLPNWLNPALPGSGWTLLDESASIAVSDDASTLRLFSQTFAQGEVVLGGAQADGFRFVDRRVLLRMASNHRRASPPGCCKGAEAEKTRRRSSSH